MSKRNEQGLRCVLVAILLAAMPAYADNLLTNGTFEKWENGTPAGWHWFRKDGNPHQVDNPTPVGMDMAEDEAYAGERSIHFWKSSSGLSERYGMLYQDVKNLPAGAKLRVRAMVKGQGVGFYAFGIWSSRPDGPTDDYDWREFSGDIQVPEGKTEIRFMILIVGKTDSLWLDELSLTLEGEQLPPLIPSDKASQGRVIDVTYNYIKNGSFETLTGWSYRDPLDPWKYQPRSNDYKVAAFTRDPSDSTHGFYSFGISKKAGGPPATLDQKITDLTPGTTLRYSVMLKGQSVKGASLSLGDTHTPLPDGDFDWREFTGKTKLANDQSECSLSIRVTEETRGLWLDHVLVWPEGQVSNQGDEHLLIRRVQPSSRPGVQTILGTRPYLESQTGFELLVRNPEPTSSMRTFTLNWTLCDAFGAPMQSKRVSIKLNALEQKRIMIPLTSVIKKQRVVCLIATLEDSVGHVLANDLDYITSLPDSLAPIKASRRFGYNLIPYYTNAETTALYMDLVAASGCGSNRYSHIARSYNVKAKKLNLDAYKWLFSMSRRRGIETIPTLFVSPTWASTAPPDAADHTKRFSMPQLDVWRDLCQQYVREHKFKTVEVWNEPNGGMWVSFPKDKTYAQMLTATYEAVKEVDPEITVLGCATNTGGISWPESVLKAGGKMDAISFHPYRWPTDSYRSPSIEKPLGAEPAYPQVIEEMNTMSAKYNNGKPLPLYVTELGFPEITGSDEQNIKKLHGLGLYKSQYLVRTYLTLAGLGVESINVWHFGDFFDMRIGVGIHRDFVLKPGWWANRTLHEVAGTREVGELTELSNDVFSVTMTDHRNAVAVWTVEDPAIVGTTKIVREARDLFGRPIEPIAAAGGSAYVIPAGSVIYLIGDASHLASKDIQPLVRFAADKWKVPPGGKVEYNVQTTAATADYFPEGLPKTCSLTFDDPAMVRWGGGELRFSIGQQQITVPAMVPVRDRIGLKLLFNEQCYPEVRIENNLSKGLDAAIEIRAGDKVVQTKTLIPTSAVHKQAVPVLPQDSAKPLDVKANVTLAGKQFDLSKPLYYAGVSKRTMQIDGKYDDWKTVKRIDLLQWRKRDHSDADAGNPEDFSARMALAHDQKNCYVLVEVTDDLHHQPYVAGQSWQGDSVQLAFDPQPMGDHGRIELEIAQTGSGQEIIFGRPLNAIDETEVQFKISRRGTQTLYEMAFPLAALRIKGGRGTRLGFSLLVNENDGAQREGYLRWAGGIGRSQHADNKGDGKYPEEYGQLLFVE